MEQPVLQGRYQVIGRLGQGGMGTVYMARDQRLANRPCVVKKLRDDFFRQEDQEKALSMFEREAHVLSQLDHPNIVHILDYFEEEGGYFLVMEYIEGRDLAGVLKERGAAFDENQVIDWASQICDVLEYLHEHDPPVIYRDLKPSNIMLDLKGRVKLVDFGIARPFDPNAEGTHVVSAGYSPPEQYWGEADVRSDIYSLGATCYFLLTSLEPSALHVLSPKAANSSISNRLNDIVEKATAQDPYDRYQSSMELKMALVPQKIEPRGGKKRGLVEIALAFTLIVVAVLALFAYMRFEDMLSKQTAEQQSESALNSKLKSYSRAVEAEEKAIDEWRQQAAAKVMPTQPEKHTALVEKSEKALTDPEGLSLLDK